MASEEIVIPHDQEKTPPILPKNETETNSLEHPERSSSPEENCSICLNEFENKSFTDSCFHKFCFVCILEWSKVKAVCPLCKTSFKSIIHNIVSNEIYDQYHLQQNNTPVTDDQDGRRFRYRTTLTDDHRYAWQLRRTNALLHITREESRRYHELRLQNQRNAAYNYRRYIYAIGVRVKQTRWNRFSGYRDVSLDFFQRNPATVYRLVPWMQRDLSVIFNGDQNNVLFVTEFILSLIQRVDLQTPEFRNNLEGFLLNKTDHFVHEFINYARSPYDVETYDQMAQYNFSRPGEPPVDINVPLLAHVISSDSDSDSDIILDLSSHSRVDILSPTHNPPPPVESELNIAPGTSGASSNTQLVKQENDNTEIDVTNVSSDVEIIGFLKPYHERTPEVVVLSSDTEEEVQPTCRKCGQPKHASKCKKIKRKPKTARLYEFYQRSSSSGDYHRSSRSRSRSRSRRKHDRSSRSSSREFETYSHSTSRSKTRKRFSKYNWIKSSSSSGNYSSDTEDSSRNLQMSNYSKSQSSKSSEKYQRSNMKPYKSYSRYEKSSSRPYKHQSRSQRSRSRSVESRSQRPRSRSVESRSQRPRSRSAESRSRSKSVESRSQRSRSKSHSRSTKSHSISRSRPYRSPSRSYRSHSRSRSRSKSRSQESQSRSHDREPSSWLDGHDKYHLKYRSSGGKSSNIRNQESQKRHRISERRSSPKSRYYRSSSRSKSHKKKHSRSRSRSIEEVAVPTIPISHKRRSKEKQEARQRRREKRQLKRRKKAANSKDLVCIDLTESADEKVEAGCREIMTQSLLIEEEVSTMMNQSENDIFLAQTSGVGPMRAMLPDDIAQAQDDPSLDVVDDLPASTDLQPLEPIKKTALDLLIEAEKIRLHGLLDKNDDGNFGRDNEMN